MPLSEMGSGPIDVNSPASGPTLAPIAPRQFRLNHLGAENTALNNSGRLAKSIVSHAILRLRSSTR